MKRFRIKVLLLSLVMDLMFFTFYSDNAFTESWEYNTTFPFSATTGETETVWIQVSIN